jgi:uncharacterized protein (DUF2336 family)
MIIRRFLLWARMASATDRAHGAGHLARAFLQADLTVDERSEARTALISLLDDPAPVVRRAIAEAMGSAYDTPRAIAVSLAHDQSDIAAIVLARSPVLTDADLIEAIRHGDDLVQTAIAIRTGLSQIVTRCLAERGSADALIALADNHGAPLAPEDFMAMLDRHGADARLRDAIAGRDDLPVAVRQQLTVALARALSLFTQDAGWLGSLRGERVTREAQERATLALALDDEAAIEDLIGHLRETDQLTPSLILRALLSGATQFVEAVLSELSGLPRSRVAGLMNDRRLSGFSALYRNAGLPASLAPAFHAAIAALQSAGKRAPVARAQLIAPLVEAVVEACEDLPVADVGALQALLNRFLAEASRESARVAASDLADQAALQTLLEIDPDVVLLNPEPQVTSDAFAPNIHPAAVRMIA